MPTILVHHRPGRDRDALLSLLLRKTLDIEISESLDALRARLATATKVVVILEGASIPAGQDLSFLKTSAILCLGKPPVALEAPTECLEEPYFLPAIQEALARLSHRVLDRLPSDPENTPPPWAPLVRGLAHAINNPLAAASGWLQLIVADTSPSERRFGALRQLGRELDRLEQISRALAVIGHRPGSNHGDVDILTVLERQVSEVSREGLPIRVVATERPPRVQGDATDYGLIFDLLLSSFLEERSRVGEVVITVTFDESAVRMEIHLEGEGLPLGVDPSDLGLLLREVRQTRALGIGLAYAVIVSRFGGEVRLPNQDEPNGPMALLIPLSESTHQFP